MFNILEKKSNQIISYKIVKKQKINFNKILKIN